MRLPVSDIQKLALNYASYQNGASGFEEFMFSLCSLITNRYFNCVNLLMKMSLFNDGSMFLEDFSNNCVNYLILLFSIPDFFQEGLNEPLVAEEMVNFFLKETQYDSLITKLISSCQKSQTDMGIFVLVLRSLAQKANNATLGMCIPFLYVFSFLLTFQEIRCLFANSDLFYSIMHDIFSQSAFPFDSKERSMDYFSSDPNRRVTENSLSLLNNSMNNYHTTLFEIMKLLMGSSTRDITMQMINKAINECATISKDYFMYTEREKNRRAEAFGFNIESVLIRLALLYQGKIHTIDPVSPYHRLSVAMVDENTPLIALKGSKAHWVDERNQSRQMTFNQKEFNEYTEDDDEDTNKWNQMVQNASTPTGSSQFFFGALRAMNYVSCSFIRLIPMIHRQLRQAKDVLQSNNNLPEFRKKFVQDMVLNLELSIVSIQAHLMLQHRYDRLFQFFLMALDFINYVSKFDPIEARLPPHPPIEYQRLPEYVLLSPIEYVLFLFNVSKLTSLELLLPRVIIPFSNPAFIRSPFVKSKIVELFAGVAEENHGNRHLVAGIPHIIDLAFPSVIDFFSSVQITGSHTEYYDKFEFRDNCQVLLKFWFIFTEFREFFVDHRKEKRYEEFVFHLVDDTLSYIDQTMTAFNALSQSANNNDPEMQAETNHRRGDLRFWSRYCMKALALIEKVSSFCLEAFIENDIVRGKLSTLLLYALQTYIMKNEILTISNPSEIEWSKDHFFALIVGVLSNCTDQRFVKDFVKNSRFYNDQMMIKALSQCTILSNNVQHRFNHFVNAVIYEKANEFEINLEEIEERFCDPLTCELMKDPVELPSGTIIDRSSFENALCNDSLDPLTRQPIKAGDEKPCPELKKEIECIIAQKKAERLLKK